MNDNKMIFSGGYTPLLKNQLNFRYSKLPEPTQGVKFSIEPTSGGLLGLTYGIFDSGSNNDRYKNLMEALGSSQQIKKIMVKMLVGSHQIKRKYDNNKDIMIPKHILPQVIDSTIEEICLTTKNQIISLFFDF